MADALRAGKDYFAEYIPTAKEYRVHVFNGRIIRVAEKILTDAENACPYIRNHEHGCTFRRPRPELGVFQEAIAASAVQSLNLNFGAVDLIVGDDGNSYVLEVNTAPACSPRTGREYVNAMMEAITALGVRCEPNLEALEELRDNTPDDLNE
jgi:glutathione synthase/RimK-type ligase-like ATP-grasp enzyme